MDTQMLVQVLMMCLTSGLSAALGWISSKYKAAQATSAERKKLDQTMQSALVMLMGRQLDEACDAYEGKDHATTEDANDLLEVWALYSGCGGDGVRKARVERLTGVKLTD